MSPSVGQIAHWSMFWATSDSGLSGSEAYDRRLELGQFEYGH